MKLRITIFLYLLAFAIGASPPASAQSLAKTFTLNAANQCAPIGTNNLPTVGIDVSGTFSLTLTPYVSINGQTKRASQAVPSSSNTPQPTITMAGGYTDPFVGGYDNFLLCVSSYSSGSVTLWLNPSPALNGSVFGAGGSGLYLPLTGGTLSGTFQPSSIESTGNGGPTTLFVQNSGSGNYQYWQAAGDNSTTFADLYYEKTTPALFLQAQSSDAHNAYLALYGSSSFGPVQVGLASANIGFQVIDVTGGDTTFIYPDGAGSTDNGTLLFEQNSGKGTGRLQFNPGNVVGSINLAAGSTTTSFAGGGSLTFALGTSNYNPTVAFTGSPTINVPNISGIVPVNSISTGTTFTSSGGLDETTLVGGATAGKFTTATVTSGSTVITMGNSATAPHGWHCDASDITHPLDIIVGTSASTTTCTLTVAVAITAGDVIEFSAIGY